MADFTFLRNTRCDGFNLMATASFQVLGNQKIPTIFWLQHNDGQAHSNFLHSVAQDPDYDFCLISMFHEKTWWKSCMNFSCEYLISSSRGKIISRLNKGDHGIRHYQLFGQPAFVSISKVSGLLNLHNCTHLDKIQYLSAPLQSRAFS